MRVDGLAEDGGIYRLRLTEELWEAALFDAVRLWVVDAPEELELASNLRVVPGAAPQPEIVLASRGLRAPAAAWDGTGAEVTSRIARRYSASVPAIQVSTMALQSFAERRMQERALGASRL